LPPIYTFFREKSRVSKCLQGLQCLQSLQGFFLFFNDFTTL